MPLVLHPLSCACVKCTIAIMNYIKTYLYYSLMKHLYFWITGNDTLCLFFSHLKKVTEKEQCLARNCNGAFISDLEKKTTTVLENREPLITTLLHSTFLKQQSIFLTTMGMQMNINGNELPSCKLGIWYS